MASKAVTADAGGPGGAEVEAAVVDAIAQALELDRDEVGLDISLQEGFGAESLDYLEISFLLEKKFRVRLPRVNLLKDAEEHFGPHSLVHNGLMTELGLSVLRAMRPEIDAGSFRPGLRAADVGRLLTARTFIRLVNRLLEAKAELRGQVRTCDACGSERIEESPSAPELVCHGCERVWPYPPGDVVLMKDLLALGLNGARRADG